MSAGLILCGAPLATPEDASACLKAMLSSADIIAAEDTRRLLRLARDLDTPLHGKIVS